MGGFPPILDRKAWLILWAVATVPGLGDLLVVHAAGAVGSDRYQRLAAPHIVQPLSPQSVRPGETVTFEVQAIGLEPLFYQWTFNGSPLQNETNSTLALEAVESNDAGLYGVIVRNPVGSVESASVGLTVLNPPLITGQPQGQSV